MTKKLGLLVLAALLGLFLFGTVNAFSLNVDILQAQTDEPYNYNLTNHTTNINGTLVYNSVTADGGNWILPIDTATGIISFTPIAYEEGLHVISLNMSDDSNAKIEKIYMYITSEKYSSKWYVEVDSHDLNAGRLAPGEDLELDSFVLKNSLAETIEDVEYTFIVYDEDLDEVDFDELTGEVNEVDSKETVNDLVLPIAYDAEESDYYLVIEALGTASDDDDDLIDGEDFLAIGIIEFEIKRPNTGEAVIKEVIMPDEFECGENIEASVTVYNIGDKELDDVILSISNIDLGINVKTEEFELNDDDEDTKVLTFEIPADAEEEAYLMTIKATFDGTDTNTLTKTIAVECESPIVPAKAVSLSATSATIESDETAKFTITLRNPGKTSVDYTLLVSADWAEADVDPAEVTLDAGEETTAYIYLRPDSDAEGTNTAKVSVYSGSDLVSEQTLRVTVEEAESESSHILSKDMWTSTDGIATLILIIAILAVIAMFLYSKGAKPSKEK